MYLQKNYSNKIKIFVPAHLLQESSPCLVSVYLALYMMADMNGLEWMRRKTSVIDLCKNAAFFNNNDLRARHYTAVNRALDSLEEYGYVKLYGRSDDPKMIFGFDFTDDIVAKAKEHTINGKNMLACIELDEFKVLWDLLCSSGGKGYSRSTILRIYIALKMYAGFWGNVHKDVKAPVFVGYYGTVMNLLNVSRTTMKESIKELRSLGLVVTTYCKRMENDDKRKNFVTAIIVFPILCTNIKAEELTEQVELILEDEDPGKSWYKPGWTPTVAKAIRTNHERNMDQVLDIVPEDPIVFASNDIF